jgi:hypothetical protein
MHAARSLGSSHAFTYETLTNFILQPIFSYPQDNTFKKHEGLAYADFASTDRGAAALSALVEGDEHEGAPWQTGAAALLHLFAV